jgi:hypothetical protein
VLEVAVENTLIQSCGVIKTYLTIYTRCTMIKFLQTKYDSNGKGLKYNPSDRGNLIIFSMNDCGWRTVKVQNIIRIKDHGVVYANMNTLISK